MDIKNVKDSIIFNEKSLTKRTLFVDNQVLSFVLNLSMGQTLPPHQHEKSTLVMFVLSGEGEIRINDEKEMISKGSVVMAKGEDQFEIPKVTEDMSLFVTISPNPANKLYSKEI